MEICKHNIAESEIIGIGPFMTERKQDPLFPTLRYHFVLHCKQQSIPIQSDAVVTSELNDKREHDKQYLEEFKQEYEAAKMHIKLLIAEQ